MGSHVKNKHPRIERFWMLRTEVLPSLLPNFSLWRYNMELGVNGLSNQLSRTIGQNKDYDDQYTMCSFLFIQWVIFRKIYADF